MFVHNTITLHAKAEALDGDPNSTKLLLELMTDEGTVSVKATAILAH